jgi:hypothetical protein
VGNREGLLIEEARTNLLVSSTTLEDFGEQRMVKIQYSEVAPDNTLNAVLLASDNTQFGYAFNGGTSVGSGETYTFSCFYKASASDQVGFGFYGSASRAVINQTRVEADLIAGTIEAYTGTTPESYGIEAFPNGWYRCWITVTTDQSGSLGETLIFLGNGDSVYAWGAQIEEGSFPTSYIPDGTTFTSRASTATYIDSAGTLQTAAVDVARDDAYGYVDGVLKPIGLLLEGAATNLLIRSTDVTSESWEKANLTVSTTTQSTPINGVTAYKISVSSKLTLYHRLANVISFTDGQVLTSWSIVKPDEYGYCTLRMNEVVGGAGAYVGYNLLQGEIELQDPSIVSARIKEIKDGWFDIWATVVCVGNGTGRAVYLIPRPNSDYTSAFSGDDSSGLLIAASQVEEGSYPTSYILTQGSQVTRAADVSSSPQVTRAADSCVRVLGDEFNFNEGTLFVDLSDVIPNSTSDFGRVCEMTDGSSDNRIYVIRRMGGTYSTYVVTQGVQADGYVNDTPVGNNDSPKIAVSWKVGGETKTYINGSLYNSGTLNLPFGGDLQSYRLSVGANGSNTQIGSETCKTLRVFPTALSDAELITLTGGN